MAASPTATTRRPTKNPAKNLIEAPSALACSIRFSRVPAARSVAAHLRAPFELYRGMVNSGLLLQQLLDRRQRDFAGAAGGSPDVHARRVDARSQRPAVQIVDLLDARQAQD